MLNKEQEAEIQEMEKEVDTTLLDWMLSLTPMQRLKVAERYAEAAWRLQNAPRHVRLSCDAASSAEPSS
jgi:hypothetical protein